MESNSATGTCLMKANVDSAGFTQSGLRWNTFSASKGAPSKASSSIEQIRTMGLCGGGSRFPSRSGGRFSSIP